MKIFVKYRPLFFGRSGNLFLREKMPICFPIADITESINMSGMPFPAAHGARAVCIAGRQMKKKGRIRIA
jgi:hypothetical protein